MAFFTAAAAVGTWFLNLGIGAQIAIRIGAGLALNALSRALAGEPPKAKPPGIRQTIRQGAEVPRSFILGSYGTRGSLVYHNTWSFTGEDKAYYTRVTALSDLPVQGLTKVWVDGMNAQMDTGSVNADFGFPLRRFDETKTVTKQRSLPDPDRPGRRIYETYEEEVTKSNAWVRVYDGTQTTADDLLVNRVSSAARPWPSTSVGKGVVYAVVTFEWDPERFPGLPDVVYEVEGLQIADPTGGTGTADNVATAQAAAILNGITYDGAHFYGPRTILPVDAAAATATSKAPVPGGDQLTPAAQIEAWGFVGVPRKYRAGIEVSVDTPPADVLEDLMSACNGRVAYTGAGYRLQVGEPPASADFTFTDADILSTQEQRFSPFLPLADTVNAISATYPSPEEGWATQEAPPLLVAAYEAEDGDRRLSQSVDLPACPYPEQVQRLMAAALAEARRARSHTITLPARFAGVEPGDHASWTSARNGYVSKLFRVDGVVDRSDGDVTLDLTEVDPADYSSWDASADYAPVARGSVDQQLPSALTVGGFAAYATSITDGAGDGRKPAIALEWTDPDLDQVTGLEWQVRLVATGELVSVGVTPNATNEAQLLADGLVRDEIYEVRARFVAPSRRADWTSWVSVTTLDVSEVPPTVRLATTAQNFAYDASGNLLGSPAPTSATFTASPWLVPGTPYYEFLETDAAGTETSKQNGTSNTYAFTPPASISSPGAMQVRVKVRSDSASGDVLAEDVMTLALLREGGGGGTAVRLSLSNEVHTVPADNDGSNPVLTGSGTNLYVYDGTTTVAYDGTGTANGTWKVDSVSVVSGTATVDTTATDSGTYATFGDATALTTDVAVVRYTVSGTDSSGNSFGPLAIDATLTKARAGVKGDTGATGPAGSDGTDGTDGTDGKSVYTFAVYRRAASAPSTPTGGSWDFGTASGTAPSGWSVTVPSGTDPVYISQATASVTGTSGTDSSLSWSTPVTLAENGLNGADAITGYITPRTATTITKNASGVYSATYVRFDATFEQNGVIVGQDRFRVDRSGDGWAFSVTNETHPSEVNVSRLSTSIVRDGSNATATITYSFSGQSLAVSIPMTVIIFGEDGGPGPEGDRTWTGKVYYDTLQATSPGAPDSGVTPVFNESTGQFTTLAAGWGHDQPVVDATDTTIYEWSSFYRVTVDSVTSAQSFTFSTPASAIQIPTTIQSDNFVANSSGWSIDRTGNIEINSLVARGTVRSTVYTAGSAGWEIAADGSAEFNDVTVRGELVASGITITGTFDGADAITDGTATQVASASSSFGTTWNGSFQNELNVTMTFASAVDVVLLWDLFFDVSSIGSPEWGYRTRYDTTTVDSYTGLPTHASGASEQHSGVSVISGLSAGTYTFRLDSWGTNTDGNVDESRLVVIARMV